jgi:hypothetical protein
VEDPSQLGQPAAVDEDDNVLGQIFGSKDVSREVTARASGQPQAVRANRCGGLLDMLSPMLDGNKDGSVMDELAGMMGRI